MAFTFRKDERGVSPITFPFMRRTIIPVTRKLFTPRIINPENMPLTGPCFIFGNHSNYFDPFFINLDMTTEPTAGVMTRDQFHRTIPRIFMDSIGIVPTSKYVPEPHVIRDVLRMIDRKRMIVIFPEGGRRWDGRPKTLIEATLKLFWRMDIPVHPVQMHGSYLAWPRWARWPRNSSVEVRWMKPLRPSDYPDFNTFSDACRECIDFTEYTPPAGSWPTAAWKPAAGLERLIYRCPETGESACMHTHDGQRLASTVSTVEYRVDKYSRLIDRYGKKHALTDLYDHIRKLEMVTGRDGYLLEETGCDFFTIDDNHNLISLDSGSARLSPTAFEYSYGSEKGSVPLEQIHYISVERAHRFSITDSKGKTLQFTLRGSALQWEHYIQRLKKGESVYGNVDC